MKTKTIVLFVLIGGAGALAYVWYRSTVNRSINNGRVIPQPSGFNYAGTPVQDARTRPPDAPIIGYAVPRTTAPIVVGRGGGGGTTPAPVPTTAVPLGTTTGAGGGGWFDTDVDAPEFAVMA